MGIMNNIQCIKDYKGDVWELHLSAVDSAYNLNPITGTYEVWYWVMKAPKAMRDYNRIPCAVFTDWWPR